MSAAALRFGATGSFWDPQGRVALLKSLQRTWSDVEKSEFGDLNLNVPMFNPCELGVFIPGSQQPQQDGWGHRGRDGAGNTMAAGGVCSPFFLGVSEPRWCFAAGSGWDFILAPPWVFPYVWLLGISPGA